MFFRKMYANSAPHAKKIVNDFRKTPTGQFTENYLTATFMLTVAGGLAGAGIGMLVGVLIGECYHSKEEWKIRLERRNNIKKGPNPWINTVENTVLETARDCGTGAAVGAFLGSLPVTYPVIKFYIAVGGFLTDKSKGELSKPQEPESFSPK